MKIKISGKIFLFLFFAWSVSCVSALNAEAPLKLKVRAWPTQATIGDEIKLTIQIERQRGFSIQPPSPKIALNPFELKSVEVLSYSEKGSVIKQAFLLRLTVFQLGELQVPPVPIHYIDASGKPGQTWTEPVKIKVTSVIKGSKEKADIRPIKGPVSISTLAFWTLVFGITAFVLSMILTAKILLRRRNRTPIDPEIFKPAHERAMLELGRLEAKGYLGEGKAKEFYSELADILRRYLDRRFQAETFERTTFEIVGDLKEKNFDSGLIEKIKELLDHSDLVKFARLVPARSAADKMAALLKDIVEKTAPSEEERTKK